MPGGWSNPDGLRAFWSESLGQLVITKLTARPFQNHRQQNARKSSCGWWCLPCGHPLRFSLI
jgi:hypothetical protein